MTDPELIEAIRAGRRGAPTALFNRYRGTVERVLYRYLGPGEDVADVVQEVFCVAFESLHRVRQPGALRSWIVGIAVRKARRRIHLRRRDRIIHFVPPNVLFDVSAAEGVTALTEAKEALRGVQSVLFAMPAQDRLVFTLRYIASMELVAIADACQISLATVKRQLVRAHQTFAFLAKQQDVLASRMNGEEGVA